jgi:hypothetical protein
VQLAVNTPVVTDHAVHAMKGAGEEDRGNQECSATLLKASSNREWNMVPAGTAASKQHQAYFFLPATCFDTCVVLVLRWSVKLVSVSREGT